jgi:nucleotide-binding universal stress UspA family protein
LLTLHKLTIMRPIVVPVDFPDSSSNAARYAADLALAINADVHLIHVLEPPIAAAELPVPEYIFEEMQQEGVTMLRSLSGELSDRTGNKVRITSDLDVGAIEYRLEEFCRQIDPLLVVTANAPLARKLPSPALYIPENAVFHAIKKIVLACELDDLGAGIPASLPFLKELASLLDAKYQVINISTRAEDREGNAVFSFDSWEDRLKELFPHTHFERSNNIADSVNKYLCSSGADWLIVFPKRHKLLDFHVSQSKKIAKACTIPVMSVHA